MPHIKIGELQELVRSAVAGQGFDDAVADALAVEFVSAEAAGTTTHGVGKLISMNLGDPAADPTISVHGSVLVADGNGVNGFVLLRTLTAQVIDLAKANGVAAAFARNFSRYSSLYPYTEALAAEGLVGILMNEAGPPAVAPFGSIDPVTGTNPISFSFPSTSGPQTIDLATSSVVWGAIRKAALEGSPLPVGAFIDVDGNEPSGPDAVNAVRAFGGPKGFAINLAVEILAGALVGGAMGKDVQSEFDCGALLIAFDPSLTLGLERFQTAVDALLDEVRGTRAENGGTAVRAPGDSAHGGEVLEGISATELFVPDLTVEMLNRMAGGENLQELASNPLFN